MPAECPNLGFPTEDGRFVLDIDASLFAVGGGVLNQLQEDREVVITYASWSLRLSQRRYCTTRREMPVWERRRYHDFLFAGHLGVCRTVYRLLDRVYWTGLRQDVCSYLASCSDCLAVKSPCPQRALMGHVAVGHRWDRVAMDILDMSVTTPKGNRYVLVMVDCFSRWTEACPLLNKTALAVSDAFFQLIVCRFGMLAVIHSDQGRKFENHLMPELCLLCGAHKTHTTPYHLVSDGLVKRFNRTLLMYVGENWDNWDDLLLVVMLAYHSSVHESTGFSPYCLMFGEECTLPMDVGLPRRDQDSPEDSLWVGPYLVVSLAGWAVGFQLQPDSPIILVHCQDLKKIPHPSGLVSWIDVTLPESLPAPPILGASMVCRSAQNSPSTSIVPPVDRALLSGGVCRFRLAVAVVPAV